MSFSATWLLIFPFLIIPRQSPKLIAPHPLGWSRFPAGPHYHIITELSGVDGRALRNKQVSHPASPGCSFDWRHIVQAVGARLKGESGEKMMVMACGIETLAESCVGGDFRVRTK